jgi:hypothetical protein
MWIESPSSLLAMRRCEVEKGGCGQLVEFLFESGLCQKCDAMVARGTAAVGGPPKRRGRKPGSKNKPKEDHPVTVPLAGNGNGAESPRKKRKYVRRKPVAKYRPQTDPRKGPTRGRPRASENGQTEWLMEQREQYASELAQAEADVVRLRIKVEVANEILSKLQRAH